MPPLRRIARRTARRTARRQSGAAPPPQAAPEAPAAAAPAAPAAPEEPAYMAELEQLNQLKEQGILSEEEYAAKKQQILGLYDSRGRNGLSSALRSTLALAAQRARLLTTTETEDLHDINTD